MEYKKAPDLAARRELCDQTRGRSYKPGRKPSQNEQAIFRPILTAAAAEVGAAGASVMEDQFRPSIAGIKRGAFPWDTP